MPLESLSKDEIIQKYKGLLGIAKKAKQAKDGKLVKAQYFTFRIELEKWHSFFKCKILLYCIC